ncbi:MAG: tyrosine-type recombinase/integrase [Sulfuriferula sp.]
MAIKIQFSKDVIKGLPLPDSGVRVDYQDTKTAGLQLRVTSKGVKTFSFLRRINGSLERITLGRFPEVTLEQARDKIKLIAAEIVKGENPAQIKRAHREEPTFSEVFDLFIPGKRKRNGQPLSERTKTDYRDSLRIHLSKIKNLKLSRVGRDDVRRAHAAATKISPASANRAVAIVSSVFNYAIDELEIYSGPNPAAKIKKNYEAPRERFAQADEMPRLVAAMAEDPLGDFFMLALLTGARRANLQAMRKSELTLDEGLWRIQLTKNGTSQNVTLSPEAVTILRNRIEAGDPEEDFVFPSTGKTGHLAEPKAAWARILKKAEIEDLRIHDLRRTLGSWQAKAGASLSIIGKSLNHKTHQATAIYARLDLDPVRASVDTATSAMMVAAGVKKTARVKRIKGA